MQLSVSWLKSIIQISLKLVSSNKFNEFSDALCLTAFISLLLIFSTNACQKCKDAVSFWNVLGLTGLSIHKLQDQALKKFLISSQLIFEWPPRPLSNTDSDYLNFSLNKSITIHLKAALIGSLLHVLQNDNMDEDYNDLIKKFSLQMIHQKIEYSAAGFFHIDYSLFVSVSAQIS